MPPNAGQIAYLYNHYGTVDIKSASADNAVLAQTTTPLPSLPTGTTAEAAGLQLAIWELEYGATTVGNITSVLSYTSAAEVATINTWASFYISDSSGKSETATFLQANGTGVQGGDQGVMAAGKYNFGNVLSSTPATAPTISTTIINANGFSLAQPAALGTSVEDTASFLSAVSGTPTGTVTYTLSGSGLQFLTAPSSWNAAGSGASTTWTDTVIVNSDWTIPNSPATGPLVAGTDYSFSATFSPSGSNYLPSTSSIEPLTIGQGTSSVLTTIFDPTGGAVTGVLGEKVYDTATVTASPSALARRRVM